MSETPIMPNIEWNRRQVTISWMPAPFMPPPELTTQVYGFCFTEHRKVVLVSNGEERWNLPGGTPAPGETLEQALAREVWEKACGRVVRSGYIGCQRIDDPDAPDGQATYYQAHFWTRVEAYPFKPQFEAIERKLVDLGAFLATLSWGTDPSAKSILDRALQVENRNGSGCI
jgi:ADP-ribose pyrophosphatase YjhB (NUDIX family)